MAKDTFHVVPHNEEWWVKREGHDQPASTLYPIGNADCFLVVNGWGNSPRGGRNAAGHSASLDARAPHQHDRSSAGRNPTAGENTTGSGPSNQE
jgi:hypothetical protein